MSQVKITGNASGTGVLTIAAPNTNTDRTINIPDTAGDIVTTGDSGTISASMLDGGQTGSAPAFAVRAWVKFVASGGTPTIGASGNVSSLTDDGVGKVIVNFTTALQDIHYATQFTAQDTVTNAGSANFALTQTTSSVKVWHFENGTYRDSGVSGVTIVR